MTDARTAVVTGAAGGIGSAICDYLEANGWAVVAVDRRPTGRAGALQIDMGDPEAIMAGLSSLERVDALVNNAAVQVYRPLLDTDLEQWNEVHDVNLRAPWICMRAVAEHLTHTGGAIVNIGSVHAAATSLAIGAYATMKGGLAAFTRAAALELATVGVRVNCILPGAIDTPALRAGFSRRADAEEMLIARTPLQRVGRPEEVAALTNFLLDGALSGFITGVCIPVDGGVLARLSSE
jgi:NAD(P)-dependent dehydrogenase (short-subunit alcohol dehydrogenase family)